MCFTLVLHTNAVADINMTIKGGFNLRNGDRHFRSSTLRLYPSGCFRWFFCVGKTFEWDHRNRGLVQFIFKFALKGVTFRPSKIQFWQFIMQRLKVVSSVEFIFPPPNRRIQRRHGKVCNRQTSTMVHRSVLVGRSPLSVSSRRRTLRHNWAMVK